MLTPLRTIEQQIQHLVESSVEDVRVPEAVAAYADARVGKQVTKTDAARLAAQLGVDAVTIDISRAHGMTSVTWSSEEPKRRQTIVVASSDVGVTWPSSAELRSRNPAYYAARDERNAARAALSAEQRQLDRLPEINPSKVEQAAALVLQLREARAALDALLDYGQPLAVVRHDVEKLLEKA